MVMYSGENAAGVLLNCLQEDIDKVYNDYIKEPLPMKGLTKEEEEAFTLVEICHICGDKRKKTNRLCVTAVMLMATTMVLLIMLAI